MGIGVVLVVYFIVMSLLATGCSVVLVAATRWYLRDVAIGTQTLAKKEFASEADLASFAKQGGVVLALRPIADVYSKYRNDWFQVFAGVILVVEPAIALWWLIRLVLRLKREGLEPAGTLSGEGS